MANVLPFPLRVKVITHLVEGVSVRATGRLCGVDKDAVMKLGAMIGLACIALHAKLVKGARCALLEVDEIWAYVGRHQRRLLPTDPPEYGDNYTMFAIDPVSKLVPSFLTGPRDGVTALRFARDIRARVVGKPQVSVDGWPVWSDAFRAAFGWNGVDLGASLKEYQTDADPRDPGRKYSPSRVKRVEKRAILGSPREDDISTSIAERLNLTGRMQQRRLTRLTNAYSKKQENLVAAVGLHFAWYNWVRVHEAIGTTPAVAAGLASAPWSMAELVAAALEIAESAPEPTTPAPAPTSPVTTDGAPLPSAETWREMEQETLPGIDAAPANDVEGEDDAPPTVREPVPYGESAAE